VSRLLLSFHFLRRSLAAAASAAAAAAAAAAAPQEARFRAVSLEPELQNLRLKDGSREVTYLYANKGL